LSGTPGQITIAAGETSGSITLHANVTGGSGGRKQKSKNKTASLILHSGTGYKVGKPKKATVTIAP
jgi:hypothetical protein